MDNVKLTQFLKLIFLILVTCFSESKSQSRSSGHPYEVIFSWKYFDFNFPSQARREQMLKSGEYNPANITCTGIKVYGARMFLALPRARLGVPSTLNVIKLDDKIPPGSKAAPPLNPYPSWEMQQIGNCEAFQFAQSMEIDEFGRLWVFDAGRINILAEDSTQHGNFCPAKLLIFDLATDKIIAKHEFPPEVVSRTTNFLNDITIGCEEGGGPSNCWAYLSDTNDAKIIVFNLQQNKSWFVRHNNSMAAEAEATIIPILGKNYNFSLNIDGITLSPKSFGHDRVYYSPTSSFGIYSIPTLVLKSSKNGDQIRNKYVTRHITRSSQSDGIMMDSEGHLYYGVIQNNSVAYVDTSTAHRFKKEMKLIENDEELQWADAFSFDNQGYTYIISIKLQRFLSNTINLQEINYRVVRVYTGSRSYVYPSEKIPKFPEEADVTRILPPKKTTVEHSKLKDIPKITHYSLEEHKKNMQWEVRKTVTPKVEEFKLPFTLTLSAYTSHSQYSSFY